MSINELAQRVTQQNDLMMLGKEDVEETKTLAKDITEFIEHSLSQDEARFLKDYQHK